MRPGGRKVAAAAAIAAVAAATFVVSARQVPILGGGPLPERPAHGWSITAPVGKTFTDGLEFVYFRGVEDPVHLESVELIGGEGLEIVGVKLNGPKRELAWMSLPNWPPKHPKLVHLLDADTPMGSDPGGYELLIGLKVTEPGYLVRDGLRITYSINGWMYARDYPAFLAVCTSREYWKNGECPAPKG